jgi:Icc-related predicted phosphoesterase
VATVVCLSDTHLKHAAIAVPRGDVLLHAGDCTKRGTRSELEAFLRWYGAQPAAARILVAGNHDAVCEERPALVRDLCQKAGVIYLCDEEVVVEGLRIWGSPVTPRFRDMAFNVERGAAMRAVWEAIPTGLDILVTHGPPRGVGDRIFLGTHVGCAELLERVKAVQPKVHVFGHIHEAHGEHSLDGCATRFYNVANARLTIGVRAPTVIEVEAEPAVAQSSAARGAARRGLDGAP